MIDLEKLEKEIDELLECETSSSLTNWLLNKRFVSHTQSTDLEIQKSATAKV